VTAMSQLIHTDRALGTIWLPTVLFGILAGSVASGAPQTSPANQETPAFHEFVQRVQQYIKLKNAAPRLRTTTQRKEIVERRHALVLRIQAARSDAKPGDVFIPEATEEFKRLFRRTFEGPDASNVRKTIREGEPVANWHPKVNAEYPENLPVTTVPPTLLLQLPQLPAGVAYRIIGHDFVLEDTEARLIVDYIPGLIP
jgi:hypothetical protein